MRYLLPILLLATPAALALPRHANADPRTDCPTPKPCKVLVLTEEEQNVLMNEKGILATAAAARSLDLAGVTTYFQHKIASAPAGDVKEAAKHPDVGSYTGKTGDLAKPGEAAPTK